jgi:formate/nitrite transporter FocA (FNT family)
MRRLLSLWATIYVANLAGATLSAILCALVGRSLGVVSIEALDEIGRHVTAHGGWVIFSSGILAGWLMGLLSWLLRASQETISQLAVVWVVTTAIGLARLHHCIAGYVEALMAVVAGSSTTMGALGRFLGFATLGNIVGGVVFVAALKLAHARRPSRRE